MSHNITTRRPWWFWMIIVLFLIWSLIGVSMYLVEHMMGDAAYGEAFGEELVPLRKLVPWWAVAGHAFGVWGGLIGLFLFIARKRLALLVFTISFIGAVVGHIPYLINDQFKAVMGVGEYGLMAFIFAECLFILWLASIMLSKPKVPNVGDSFN